MTNQAPTLSLESQWLTPKRLMWVMDVARSTVAQWQDQGGLDYFKDGGLVRYSPDAVFSFLAKHTVKSRSQQPRVLSPQSGVVAFSEGDWRRIERLIADQVAAQKRKEAA